MAHRRLEFILAFFIFVLAFWGVRYTADWISYESFFIANDKVDISDYIYVFLSGLFDDWGYDFRHLYQFHIFVISLSYFLFISRFTRRYLLVAILLLLSLYVEIGNQIRFFMALPFCLLSLYYLFCRKRVLLFLLFALLSVLSHKAIVVVFICYMSGYLFKIAKSKNTLFYFFGLNILIYVSLNYIIQYTPENFTDYLLSDDQRSSLVGGLFNALCAGLNFIFIYRTNLALVRNKEKILATKEYQFLYLMSIVTFVVLLVGLFTQILVTRYINSLILVWILYFLYVKVQISESPLHAQYRCSYKIAAIFLIVISHRYIIPYLITGHSFYFENIQLMVASYSLN